MKRLSLAVAVLALVGCAEGPTGPSPIVVPEPPSVTASTPTPTIDAPAIPSPAPAASPTPEAAPQRPAVLHPAPDLPARLTVELLDHAVLRITSNQPRQARVTVTWESAVPYTARFLIQPYETREITPGCFLWGRYTITVGKWHRTIDYGPGVPYCFLGQDTLET